MVENVTFQCSLVDKLCNSKDINIVVCFYQLRDTSKDGCDKLHLVIITYIL